MAEGEEDIFVVLAGKSGAGKSTLSNNLLKQDNAEIELSPNPITKEVKSEKREDSNFNVVDTPGGIPKRKHIQKTFDLLVYCIPVAPGSKFRDANPAIMRSLQDAYGKKIWEHCVIVFTFSNLAWDRAKKAGPEVGRIKFKDYIEDYAREFENVLKTELKVKNVNVKTIFDRTANNDPNLHTILALPAGDDPKDAVLPGIEPREESEGWVDEIFFEMLKACKEKKRFQLARFRYGAVKARKVLKGLGIAATVSGASIGASVGAGVVLGIVGGVAGGPIGAILGGAVGGAAGLIIVGIVAGGGSATEVYKTTKESP